MHLNIKSFTITRNHILLDSVIFKVDKNIKYKHPLNSLPAYANNVLIHSVVKLFC